MAEAILDATVGGRFRAHSAGSHPAGAVHPCAIELLKRNGLWREELRSKSWEEFARPGSPAMDFVFTVCGRAAREACPSWPGRPMTAHWGVDDPAAVRGTDDEIHRAFVTAFTILQRRIQLFVSLPLQSLDALALKKNLDDIGRA
jgi:arsenate reductase